MSNSYGWKWKRWILEISKLYVLLYLEDPFRVLKIFIRDILEEDILYVVKDKKILRKKCKVMVHKKNIQRVAIRWNFEVCQLIKIIIQSVPMYMTHTNIRAVITYDKMSPKF